MLILQYQGDCPEFEDWLPLMIEVNKKEIVQTNLQNEIESLKKLTSDLLENESNESHSELAEFDETLKTELVINVFYSSQFSFN